MIKNILITGCTQGLGNALAKKFADLNLTVFAVGRNIALLEKLASYSKKIHSISADINTKAGKKIILENIDSVKEISIIHNVAIAEPCMFSSLNENLLRKHIETNYISPAILTQKILPKLQADQRVLHISSSAANLSLPGLMSYCTTKSALEHMTNCLNMELNKQGTYFANLRPGMIDTPMELKFRTSSLNELPQREFYVRAKNENKLIQPEIVAEFIAWVMLKTEDEIFSNTLWNIYNESYQPQWLRDLKFKPIPPS